MGELNHESGRVRKRFEVGGLQGVLEFVQNGGRRKDVGAPVDDGGDGPLPFRSHRAHGLRDPSEDEAVHLPVPTRLHAPETGDARVGHFHFALAELDAHVPFAERRKEKVEVPRIERLEIPNNMEFLGVFAFGFDFAEVSGHFRFDGLQKGDGRFGCGAFGFGVEFRNVGPTSGGVEQRLIGHENSS